MGPPSAKRRVMYQCLHFKCRAPNRLCGQLSCGKVFKMSEKSWGVTVPGGSSSGVLSHSEDPTVENSVSPITVRTGGKAWVHGTDFTCIQKARMLPYFFLWQIEGITTYWLKTTHLVFLPCSWRNSHNFCLRTSHSLGPLRKRYGSPWAHKRYLPGIASCFRKIHRPVFPHFHQWQKSEPRWSSPSSKRWNSLQPRWTETEVKLVISL